MTEDLNPRGESWIDIVIEDSDWRLRFPLRFGIVTARLKAPAWSGLRIFSWTGLVVVGF